MLSAFTAALGSIPTRGRGRTAAERGLGGCGGFLSRQDMDASSCQKQGTRGGEIKREPGAQRGTPAPDPVAAPFPFADDVVRVACVPASWK